MAITWASIFSCSLLLIAGTKDDAILHFERVGAEKAHVRGVETYTVVGTPGAVVVDGNLSEWEGIKPIHVTPGPEGPEPSDLSARAYLMRDCANLYLAIDVDDDVLISPSAAGDLWAGDGIQMIFDPLGDRKPGGLASDDHDLALGLTEDGAKVFRYSAPGLKTGDIDTFEIQIIKKPREAGYVYEIAIPWQELHPFKPGAMQTCGF